LADTNVHLQNTGNFIQALEAADKSQQILEQMKLPDFHTRTEITGCEDSALQPVYRQKNFISAELCLRNAWRNQHDRDYRTTR
jgi:hypothetical protein